MAQGSSLLLKNVCGKMDSVKLLLKSENTV